MDTIEYSALIPASENPDATVFEIEAIARATESAVSDNGPAVVWKNDTPWLIIHPNGTVAREAGVPRPVGEAIEKIAKSIVAYYKLVSG